MKKLLLAAILFTGYFQGLVPGVSDKPSLLSRCHKAYCIVKSALAFYPSLAYNNIRYGGTNFNRITTAGTNFKCARDSKGRIITFCDGKRVPLVLGAIPQSQGHINRLKKHFGLTQNKKVVCYSLNRAFERDWSGLSKLETKGLKVNKYPTTDYQAPSLINIIRGVRDLEDRDNDASQDLAYVHCKAGRSRSATVVAAYMLQVMYNNRIASAPQAVIRYLKEQRPQVGVNPSQQKALDNFYKQLQQAGSFNKLYARYRSHAEARDTMV